MGKGEKRKGMPLMKVVIAMDSFKGSISSLEAAEAVGEGIRRAHPNAEIVSLPLADGGEGTVDALIASLGAEESAPPSPGLWAKL